MPDGHAISDRCGAFSRAAVLTGILHPDLTELALDPGTPSEALDHEEYRHLL